ncbi:MAG: hypothetical protein J6E46_13035 [Faecalicoccus sp.]|nr:hypothetical protein [Faecalicoccus sp.]
MISLSPQFDIVYTYFDDIHQTELSMIINGINILAFEHNGDIFTTRWNLDELVIWLHTFLNQLQEDPYPVQVDGEYAAIKDENAREFDSDDINEFDAYYDKLDEWNLHHRWHTASSGAILADIYFQLVGDYIEISWNNIDCEDGFTFQNIFGGCRIPKEIFILEVSAFLEAYDKHWYSQP